MVCACPQAFQQEISLNWGRLEVVLQRGEQLMEKSEPLDATVIEDELEELQRYCQEVVSRVERYYSKLQRLPVNTTHTHTHTHMAYVPSHTCINTYTYLERDFTFAGQF